jgi:predicted kinase
MTSNPPILIVFSGLPGSGKSTMAQGLSRNMSAPVFSVDPIEAAMWRAGLAKAHTGFAAYEVAQALAEEHLRLRHSVIIDAVNPIEAPRTAWRKLSMKYRANLKIIECVCADQTVHRRRIEARVRNIDECPTSPGLGYWNGGPNTKPGLTPGSPSIRRRNQANNCLRKCSNSCVEISQRGKVKS